MRWGEGRGRGGRGWRCPLCPPFCFMFFLCRLQTHQHRQHRPETAEVPGAGGWETLYVTWTWDGKRGPGWGAGCGSSTSLQEFLATLSLLSATPPRPPAPPSTPPEHCLSLRLPGPPYRRPHITHPALPAAPPASLSPLRGHTLPGSLTAMTGTAAGFERFLGSGFKLFLFLSFPHAVATPRSASATGVAVRGGIGSGSHSGLAIQKARRL